MNIEAPDLALLDDPFKHAHCTECQDVKPGTPFLALCGKRAVGLLGIQVDDVNDFPPGAVPCPACLELFGDRCPWCGAE